MSAWGWGFLAGYVLAYVTWIAALLFGQAVKHDE